MLTQRLRKGLRSVRHRAADLVRAGVALREGSGLRLTDQPPLPLLNQAADRAGTTGAQLAAIEDYQARCEQWRLERAEASLVGSPHLAQDAEQELPRADQV